VWLNYLTQPNVNETLQETSVWTVGQIYLYHGESLQNYDLYPVFNALMNLKNASPPITRRACEVRNLFEGYTIIFPVSQLFVQSILYIINSFHLMKDQESSPLSVHLSSLIETLLSITQRKDACECDLRIVAFEALNSLIANSPKGFSSNIQQLALTLVNKLNQVLAPASGVSGKFFCVTAAKYLILF
jgi:hypothetical protein